MGRRQIVFPRYHRPVGTVRTARPRHPGFYCRLPAMPLPTAPPEGLVAAVGEGGKGYTGVFLRVKLLEQGFFTLGHTINIPALFHWNHLPEQRGRAAEGSAARLCGCYKIAGILRILLTWRW